MGTWQNAFVSSKTQDQSLTDPVMELFMRTFEGRVSGHRGFALGLYAEYRVAHLLGATPSEGGTDEVDLTWKVRGRTKPVRIQVKSCHRSDAGQSAKFSIAAAKSTISRAGDLWVFARHTGLDHHIGWEYLVIKASRLRRFGGQKTIAARKLEELADWVDDSGLKPAVRSIASALRK